MNMCVFEEGNFPFKNMSADPCVDQRLIILDDHFEPGPSGSQTSKKIGRENPSPGFNACRWGLEILSGQRREVFQMVCGIGNTDFGCRKSALGNFQCQRSTPISNSVLDSNRSSRRHFYFFQYRNFLDRRAGKGLALFCFCFILGF